MSDERKLPASAGAEWLLGGFALLRKAPVGLGLLGVLYGLIALMVGMSVQYNLQLFMLLELGIILLGPILVGGMVYAAREVDRDNSALPGHLLQGIRDGKAVRLFATLLPQIGALLLIVLLLAVMVGPSELANLAATMEKMQDTAQPDPSLLSGFPVGRMLLWLLLAIAIGILAGFFTFVGLPEIIFTDSPALPAMMRSFRACLRNVSAMIVFFVLIMIAVFALYFVLMLVGLAVSAFAGQGAMQVVMQLLLMAVLMPVITGAMYTAWKQLLGGAERAIAAPPTNAGFEA